MQVTLSLVQAAGLVYLLLFFVPIAPSGPKSGIFSVSLFMINKAGVGFVGSAICSNDAAGGGSDSG